MTSVDVINELLLEVDDETPTEPLRPSVPLRVVTSIPDALVLCTINTVCSSCNTSWEHPNPHILGRFERNHKRIEKWSSLFERLPRERLSITEEAVACSNCFEGVVLRTGNMERVDD